MNDIIVTPDATLSFSNKTYRCALGKNGITTQKTEGDLATPAGRFALRECLYRADRMAQPVTKLPWRRISAQEGWCDDSAHPDYNRKVRLPFAGSHETLWREDHAYDLLVPLGYNDDRVVPGKGSAIFLHVARENYPGTEGCVALALPDLLELLAMVRRDTFLTVEAP